MLMLTRRIHMKRPHSLEVRKRVSVRIRRSHAGEEAKIIKALPRIVDAHAEIAGDPIDHGLPFTSARLRHPIEIDRVHGGKERAERHHLMTGLRERGADGESLGHSWSA